MRRKKISQAKNWGFLFLIIKKTVIFVIFAVLLFIFSKFILGEKSPFNIRQLTCRIDSNPCQPAEEKNLLYVIGQNIFKFDRKQTIKILYDQHPEYKNITLSKIYPSEVKVSIEKRTPKIQLKAQDSENIYVAGEDGLIYKIDQYDQNLGLIIVYPAFPLGVGIRSEDINKAILADEGVKKELTGGLNYNLLFDGTLQVTTEKNMIILFNLEKDVEKQVKTLQLILARSKIEGRNINKLDLRFEKPVAVFENE